MWNMKQSIKLYASMEHIQKSPQNLRSSIIIASHIKSANVYKRPPFLNFSQYQIYSPVSYVDYRLLDIFWLSKQGTLYSNAGNTKGRGSSRASSQHRAAHPLPCAPHTLSILSAPLPEYWKFNISKNVSVLTVFTLNPQVSFLNPFFSNWQHFIKDRDNPQTHLCTSFCDTDLVSCSQWLLQASGGIQIFKYLPIAQLLADSQCGSVSAALGCTNLVHQGNMETVVPPSLWQTSLVQVS